MRVDVLGGVKEFISVDIMSCYTSMMYAESLDRGRVEAASISSFRHIRERGALSDFAKDFSRLCCRTLGR